MTTKQYTKDPDADLDYKVDWSDWLTTGETISGVAWTVADGIEQHDDTNTTTDATIWLKEGTVGRSYLVTCEITTSADRIDDRSFYVHIAQR